MSAAMASHDLAATRVRTRWSMTVSLTIHTLLVLWLVWNHHETASEPRLTEIAWIDEAELAGMSPAPASPAPRGPLPAAPSPPALRLDRTPPDVALDDRVGARLQALQGAAAEPAVAPALSASPVGMTEAPAGIASGLGSGERPLALHREGKAPAPGLTLERGGVEGTVSEPALAAARLPAQRAPAAAALAGEAGTQRTLAGATISGPAANRAILDHVAPAYPDWAKHDAVEGSVTLYFVVRSDGTVKENVLVQKTAGFEDFDENARTALRTWRFQPLRGGQTGEQWGTITFRFRLRDAG